jgi:hypothetical protein
MFAGDLQATVFAVNPELLLAARTGHVVPSRGC